MSITRPVFPGGVYGIVDGDAERPLGELLTAYIEGGAKVVQLRMKGRGAAEVVRLGRELAARCRAASVLFIVNDRADVAAAIGADGVHLGQDDGPIAAARMLLPHGLIGRSTHDERQVWHALGEGADYIGFGPLFSTKSKAVEPVGVPALAVAVKAATVPVVGIGGITIDNVRQVVGAGAQSVAVISAVASAWQPRDAVRSLVRAFQPKLVTPRPVRS